MRSFEELVGRIEKAQDAYRRECEAVNRDLQSMVNVDPVHLEQAQSFQRHISRVSVELPELEPATNPDFENGSLEDIERQADQVAAAQRQAAAGEPQA